MANTISTKTVDPIERFYEDYFLFSYSSLNKLLHSAQLFYNWYVLRERKDSLENHLVEGKAVHCLLLERKMFDDQFVVMVQDVPGTSNKKIVESMYKLWKEEEQPVKGLTDYQDQIINWLKTNNLHQKLADDKEQTGDEKRLKKVLTQKSLGYFQYLKSSGTKDVIDQATLDKCEEAVSALRENKKVLDLLRTGQDFELIEIYNERPLDCAVWGLPFGLKGIVDNYVIDHSSKTIHINDLKTTGKTLKEFTDSVEYYKYWMQAAIYTRLVLANHQNAKDYKVIVHFIVIDKYNQVYPFPVSTESMLDWQSQLDDVLEIAKYHYVKKDYTLPYEFALNQVTL